MPFVRWDGVESLEQGAEQGGKCGIRKGLIGLSPALPYPPLIKGSQGGSFSSAPGWNPLPPLSGGNQDGVRNANEALSIPAPRFLSAPFAPIVVRPAGKC